jgi:hypothetical protein
VPLKPQGKPAPPYQPSRVGMAAFDGEPILALFAQLPFLYRLRDR